MPDEHWDEQDERRMEAAGGAPRALAPPPPDWFQRNWKWALPLGCFLALAFVALCLGVVVGGLALLFGMIKQSEAYTMAMETVRVHPAAIEALGEPIEAGYFVTGNISLSGSSGEANLAIPLQGPQGSATLYVEATKAAGTWTFDRLVLDVDLGEPIDLLGMSGPDEQAGETVAV